MRPVVLCTLVVGCPLFCNRAELDPRNTNLISARQLYTLFMMLPPPLGYCGVNPRPSLEAIGEYIGTTNGVCG